MRIFTPVLKTRVNLTCVQTGKHMNKTYIEFIEK